MSGAVLDEYLATLADPRSWIGDGQVSFTRIDNGDPDIRISLTSELTIRTPDNCGWDIPLEASCFNGWMRNCAGAAISFANWAFRTSPVTGGPAARNQCPGRC